MASILRWKDEEERVLAPARMITKLYNCPPAAAGTLSLASFIAHIINRTLLSQRDLFAALLLLQRVHDLHPHHQGSSGHRLILAAMMAAHKSLHDSSFSALSWTIVGRGMGGGLDLAQVNKMERELLGYIRWDVVITPEGLKAVERELDEKYTRHYFPSPPSTPTRDSSSSAAPSFTFPYPSLVFEHGIEALSPSSSPLGSPLSRTTTISNPSTHSTSYLDTSNPPSLLPFLVNSYRAHTRSSHSLSFPFVYAYILCLS